MMHAIVLLCSVTLAFSLDLDPLWSSFKRHFQKTYSPEEDAVRKVIFTRNVAYITEHNLAADLGKRSFRLGVNRYGDWSHEEFVKYLNGLNTNLSRATEPSTFLPPNNLVLPPSVDWREKGYVTEVKDQKNCKASWAFAATGAIEGQHFRKTGKLVSLSEQNLVDCSKSEGNFGCFGGSASNAYDYVRLNAGIDAEACYPYKAEGGVCTYNSSCVGSICIGYFEVQHGNETALQAAVATAGPVSVAIDGSNKSFQFYKSGVYAETNCSRFTLDHGLLAVGYGTISGQDYWLVKNSFGMSWGNKGYMFIARNKDNMCGIATSATYPWSNLTDPSVPVRMAENSSPSIIPIQ